MTEKNELVPDDMKFVHRSYRCWDMEMEYSNW